MFFFFVFKCLFLAGISEASLRTWFETPITSAVAAVSVLIGAVALLAFYESPSNFPTNNMIIETNYSKYDFNFSFFVVSPLPVPPLPDPPVGRFPPEHPIWPPVNKGNNYAKGGQYYPKRASNTAYNNNNQLPAATFLYPVYVPYQQRSDGKVNDKMMPAFTIHSPLLYPPFINHPENSMLRHPSYHHQFWQQASHFNNNPNPNNNKNNPNPKLDNDNQMNNNFHYNNNNPIMESKKHFSANNQTSS